MDDGTAEVFRNTLQDISSNLQILPSNVPILHNLKQVLVTQRPRPNILLIAMGHMTYDTRNPKDELLKWIMKIKSDPATNNIRIAIQTSLRREDPYLRKLSSLQVWDIFTRDDQTTGQFNMAQIARQLSGPASISNVQNILDLSTDAPSLGSAVGNLKPNSMSSNSDNTDRVKQLERMYRMSQQQTKALAEKVDKQSVPREDYDELLKRVRTIINSGIDDEKTKALFREILTKNTKQEQTIVDKQSELNQKDELIRDLNLQIERLEKNATNPSELIALKQKIRQLERSQPVNRRPIDSSSQTVVRRPAKRPGSGKSNRNNAGSSSSVVKIVIWAIVALLVLGIGVGVVNHIHRQNVQRTAQQAKPSFNSLIKSGNYDQAAKYYPSRAVEAENKMMADKDLTAKGTMATRIQKYTSSDAVRFDVDYFDEDYASAVDVYKSSDDDNLTDLTDARRVMVAYSLMKCGQLADAKKVAEPLNNENLNKRIKVYGQFYNANKILKNKIENGHLSKSEEDKAKEQMKENQEAMDKL